MKPKNTICLWFDKDAHEAGTEYLKQLFADGDKWGLVEITLHPVADRWVYEIAFTEPPHQDVWTVCFLLLGLW